MMDGGTEEFRKKWLDPSERSTLDRPAGSAPTGKPMSVPMRIDRYSIKRLIGSGGMGVVYEAVQDFPKRSVALKVLAPGPDGPDPVMMQRFLDESQFLAAMKHPGICQIYDAGTYSPDEERAKVIPYLVMELIDGGLSLTTYARTLELRERVELLRRVAEAVQHGHSRGVIHRDLKPENVLVDSAGQSKIIDFGIAKAIGAEAMTSGGRTLDGQVVGTLQYMSPEQLAGNRAAVDVRTDVYALGVMLYELVCGQLPYRLGGADVLTARKIVSGSIPPRPSAVVTDIDPDLEAIIERAMNKEPERRYVSAGDMERDLARWLKGDEVEAQRASGVGHAAQRLRLKVGRHIGWSAAAIVALAAGLIHLTVPELLLRTSANDLVLSWIGGAGQKIVGSQPTLSGVVVVGPRTTAELEEFLARRGVTIPPDEAANHSLLAQEIAAAAEAVELLSVGRAGAIAVDYGRLLKSPVFREKMRASCEAGVPVVAAAFPWPKPEDEPLGDLRDVAGAQVGGLTLGEPETEGAEQWSSDAVLEQGYQATWPTLTLAAYAASRHPRLFPAYSLVKDRGEVEIRYLSSSEGTSRAAAPPDRVRLTGIAHPEEDTPAFNIWKQDSLGIISFTIPPDEELERVTIGLGELQQLSDSGTLADRLNGRIVLVGDMRTDVEYKDTTVYAGREVARVFGHAAVVSALNAPESAIHFQDATGGLVAAALGAGAGVLGGWRRRPWVLLGLALAGGTLCAFLGSVILFALTRTVMNPLLPIAGMVLAGVLAWAVMPRALRAGRS